jgi:DNA processing protein
MLLSWHEIPNHQVIQVNEEELIYLTAFKKIENVGDKTIEKLYRKFNSFKNAWYADDDRIRDLRLQSNTLTSILQSRKKIDISSIQTEIENVLSQEITIGTKFGGENYPERLRELKDAPPLVYIKGTVKEIDENALAIVGTREPSQKGKDTARNNARELAEAGYTIISGLARGIDTEAHLGALDAGGRTIAVLGTGFNRDVFYPKENYYLFNRIVENGFCISEFPPDARGLGHRMYIRNRIISILSKGVLIVEMKNMTHGGTLAQARYAKNQGRKVFVAESIDRVSGNSEGWKILKKDVEPIVTKGYEDIIAELDRPFTKQTDLIHYGVSAAE